MSRYYYASPIALTVAKEIITAFDDNIVKVLQKYDIDVDKDELIKALEYDRDQYEKGYFDGYAAAKRETPIMTEEVREALMRLTMCAREECAMCKYEKECGFEKQIELATKNMNTILNAFVGGSNE